MSVRSTIPDTDLLEYPHNAVVFAFLPTIPINKLADMPLKDIATAHRDAITRNRNLPYFQAYDQCTSSMGETLIPLRSWSVDLWACSNQSLGRPDNIDFGSGKTYMLWHYLEPLQLDSRIFINRFQDGYIVDATMRRSRWDTVAAEVKRMNEGMPSRIV
jgi:hypothetical protein